MSNLQTYGHPALQALNATFSKEQAETLLSLLAAVGGSDWDSLVGKPASFPPSAHTHGWGDIADAPEAATWASLPGKPAVIAAGATQAAARTAIGAGTGSSNLALGTSASTAKAGNYHPTWAQVTGKPATFPPTIGNTATTAMAGNTTIPAAATWANLSGKPAVIGAGADAAAARTAIGAGTGNSNLAIGTTASTAAAGNHTHTIANVSGLEARLSDIEGRLEALEPEA